MTQAVSLSAPAAARPRRRWLWRAGWATLAVVAGVGLFWVWSYYTALAERDALIAKIAARGDPVWWWDVAKERLAKSNEGTGAELYLKGIRELGGETNRAKLRPPTPQWKDEVEADKFTPRVHPLVEQENALNAPALAILEKAAVLPPGRVINDLHNAEPCSIILSAVQDMRRVQSRCHWQSFDALAKGDAGRAYHAAWLAMALSEQLANEPFVIAQMVRLWVLSDAVDQLMMCLAYAPASEGKFVALDAVLSKWDDGFGIFRALAAERAMWLTTIGQPNIGWLLTMDSRRTANLNGFNRALEGALLDLIGSKVGRPLIYRAQAQTLEAFERLAPGVDNPLVDSIELARQVEALDRDNVLQRVVGEKRTAGISWLGRVGVKCATVHRKLILARLALRLRRHYDQHGRLPGKLDDLCDAAMPKIRLEWFKGQPIGYKPSATGFRLESPEPIRLASGPPGKEVAPADEYGIGIEFKTPPARR